MKKIACILLVALMLSFMIVGCAEQLPEPEITKGEFDFTVTYEYKGETKTVSGVYVCEYEGTHVSLDGGSQRDWKGYIKGGQMEDSIYLGTAKDGGEIYLELDFYPEFFMGDPRTGGRGASSPWISVTLKNGEGVRFLDDAATVYELYGVRIISYDYDEPIQNTFKL